VLNVHVPSGLPVRSSVFGARVDDTPIFQLWLPPLLVVIEKSSWNSHHVSICTLFAVVPYVRLGNT
jgi:hypothetical protein